LRSRVTFAIAITACVSIFVRRLKRLCLSVVPVLRVQTMHLNPALRHVLGLVPVAVVVLEVVADRAVMADHAAVADHATATVGLNELNQTRVAHGVRAPQLENEHPVQGAL
jgi:hypothetical protein